MTALISGELPLASDSLRAPLAPALLMPGHLAWGFPEGQAQASVGGCQGDTACV